MASTTNFNWSTPDDTSLVKDGAAAIRTLGNSIDTSMAELKGGTTGQVLSKTSNTDMDFTWVAQDDSNAIQNAIVDAKGDIIAATGADTPARLGVGTNGQVLTADSAEATGLKWATAAAGGLTVITSFTANNTVGTYTVSSIPGTYKQIVIVGQGIKSSVTNYREIGLRFNGDTGANYSYGYLMNSATTVTGTNFMASSNALTVGFSPVTGAAVTDLGQFALTIPLYAGSNYKSVNSQWSMGDNNPAGIKQCVGSGTWANTAAITSIEIRQNTGNFNTGTITVYGVS